MICFYRIWPITTSSLFIGPLESSPSVSVTSLEFMDSVSSVVLSVSVQSSALLQSRHSGGVPEQDPPNKGGKQDPLVGPPLGGPVYLTLQPPVDWHS